MFNQAVLFALLTVTVAGAPLALQPRQFPGLGSPSDLGDGLTPDTGTATIPDPTALPASPFSGLGDTDGIMQGGAASGSPWTGGLSSIFSGLLHGTGTKTIKERQSSPWGSLFGGAGTTSSSSLPTLGGVGGTGGASSGSLPTTGTSPLSDVGGTGGASSGLGGTSTTTGSSSSPSSGTPASSVQGSALSSGGASGSCKSVMVFFARGTTEMGPLGQVVGPTFATDLAKDLNNDVTVQGIDSPGYRADAAGISQESTIFTSGKPTPGSGSEAMVTAVQNALKACPNSKVVLSGYSQGAMLVHNTMAALSATQAASVKACVTWGDPFVGTAIKNLPSSNWKSFCAGGDPVCMSGAAMSPASGGTTSKSAMSHLGYGADVQTASTFVKSKVSM